MVQQKNYVWGGIGREKRKDRFLRAGTISASTVPGTLNSYRGIRINQSPCIRGAHKLVGKPSELKKKQPDHMAVH